MHQALIVITLMAGQAYLEDANIDSLDDLHPETEISIAAEDLSPDTLAPETIIVDGKTVDIDKSSEETDFAQIIPEDEVKKDGEDGIGKAIAEAGEKVKEVATEAIDKVVDLVSDKEKSETKIASEQKEKVKKKGVDVAKATKVEEVKKEIEVVEVIKSEVNGKDEVSIKTLLIKPKKIIVERKEDEGAKLDAKQKEALVTALAKSEKEAEIIFLTDEEKLELLLEARDEMLEELEEKAMAIIPREKTKRRFVEEDVPSELVRTMRSLDNRHIPLILSDEDLIEIAFDAIQEGDTTKLRSIVKDLKDPNIINKQSGETALTYATKYKSHNIMKFLIFYGADLDIGNYKSDSPLHIAVNNNDEYALDLLLERSPDINVGDMDEKTPLMLAIETNQPNAVKTLVHYGADLEAIDSKGLTALDIARKNKNQNIERFLLKTISEKEMLSAKREKLIL